MKNLGVLFRGPLVGLHVRCSETYRTPFFTASYIPKKECNKRSWGDKTKSKEAVYQRNLKIYQKYNSGTSVKELSEEYYLSPKWIYKIIAKLAS